MSWDDVRDAMQAAIVTASGLPSGQVIWGFQDANEPPMNYVSMQLGPTSTMGIDWVTEEVVPNWAITTPYVIGQTVLNDTLKRYVCVIAGTSAGAGGPTGTGTAIVDGTATWNYAGATQELRAHIEGFREVSWELQFFTKHTADNFDANTLAENTRTSLLFNSVRDILRAQQVSPFDPGPVNYLPEVVGTNFRGRATCSVRCYIPAQALFQYYGTIKTVNGSTTYSGGQTPGSHTFNWTAKTS